MTEDEAIKFEKPEELIDWLDRQWEVVKENPERYKFAPSDFEKVFDWALRVSYRQAKP